MTAFDDEIPAVTTFDRELLSALCRHATNAAEDGAEFYVDSGRHSLECEKQLVRDAFSMYGLGPICRNELWHYELRTHAIDRGCPRMYAEPTQDPRPRQ
ncbi:M15 family metallopeptidase [Streptomyces lacrimifluminis]|uniref:D-alanyl-D-alanine carboxypeptidase n=1 Tax=Streptomyces lacrimifluminis TaxID=1500077 RepID=A0A917P968_9ACTN|nr:hypothetical protein [Streptomyces lacrimifluminis]GGJ67133.1 D-alanyl-D-alanine carboxypeptidase [Streptomyces lacrimifluminis]